MRGFGPVVSVMQCEIPRKTKGEPPYILGVYYGSLLCSIDTCCNFLSSTSVVVSVPTAHLFQILNVHYCMYNAFLLVLWPVKVAAQMFSTFLCQILNLCSDYTMV